MRTTGVVRLRSGDQSAAADTFTLLATVFGEASEPLPVAYLHDLLEQPGFWVYAAYVDGQVVGGLTAHTLPMTNRVGSELIIYDIAVVESHQRRGIGAELLRAAAEEAARAGATTAFVLADDEDRAALDFYRAQGWSPAAVTMFSRTRSGPRER